MKNLSIVVLFVIACLAFTGDNKISVKDFTPVFGKWKGSLTYLDYKSGKPYTMPANVTIAENTLNNHQLILVYEYPNEPKANGNDTITIDKEGMQLDKSKVIHKGKLANGNLEIITEENGKDGNDNKPAILKRTYLIGDNHFSIQKDVQFNGETKWIERHIYSFER